MLLQFLNVLLQALVYRSHDLLQEEITITLYNMAAVDFDSFYSAFLPRFLGGCEGLTDSQKTELGKNFTLDKVIAVNSIIMNKISDIHSENARHVSIQFFLTFACCEVLTMKVSLILCLSLYTQLSNPESQAKQRTAV